MRFIIFSSLLFALSTNRLAAEWRLSGLIDMPENKQAIFENADMQMSSILNEGEKAWDIAVTKIDSKNRCVEVINKGKPATMNLSSNMQIGQTKTPPTFILDHASIHAALNLYSDLVHRTLLRHPLLPETDVTINSQASNKDAAAQIIEKVLTEKGMTFIPDGDVFRMVVPQQMAATIQAESLKVKVPEPKGTRDISYNFPGVPFQQAADIFASLFGCQLDPNQNFLPETSTTTITLLTETRLNKDEAIYALRTLFAWSGVKLVPTGQNLMKIVPLGKSRN